MNRGKQAPSPKAAKKPAPQPKWELLRVMNVVVTAAFISILAYVFINYRQLMAQQPGTASPITGTFFPIMIAGSLCLVYFFGFFGISFLDTEAISSQHSEEAAATTSTPAATTTTTTTTTAASTSTSASREESQSKKTQPRHDGPICSDKKLTPIPENLPEDVNYADLDDDLLVEHLKAGTIKDYELEKKLGDCSRAVTLRRRLFEHILDKKLDLIPYAGYDYGRVFGANCEIVIGYVPLPVGIVGPLLLNGEPVFVPMATTEGCLVASTNRGCKAISAAGGCFSVLLKDGITRAPCLKLPSAMRAAAVKRWIETPENYARLEEAFNSTTNFGRLDSIEATVAGRNVYLRFCCMAGDAMGMNMVSKGCLKSIELLEGEFPDMVLVAISGNMCIDKKPAAINWILGRGKSVVVEAIVPDSVVKGVLKSSVYDMIETNKQKNLVGSAMAGSIGGFNAHAANIVTAVFLATGQDPAQNVGSSNCITMMDFADDGKSLQVSVTMPSIEVGTVGGGTHLPAQAGCLEICGVRGASRGEDALPGDNARQLAQIVGAAVLAGELSLIAALAANHLVRSHMVHNRKPQTETVVVDTKTMRKFSSMPELTAKPMSSDIKQATAN